MMANINRSDDDDGTKIQNARGDSPSPIVQAMNTYGREFWFILAVVFTAFAALQNSPPKTRKANPPQKFFSSSSLVADFYSGNLQAFNSLVLENDIAVVLYYAPWDAGSKLAREEFEAVARYYHTEIFFAAINCWWPEGECYKTYKFLSYPLISVHIYQVGSIKYRGPMVANYIIAFLDNVITPFVSVKNEGELLDLQTKHEAVLLGFFRFHNATEPVGYSEYYAASLKALSPDYTRRLIFAILTDEHLALKLNIVESTSLVLYLWNETQIYPGSEFNAEGIIKWAFSRLHQIAFWLTPPGTKSSLLSQVVEKSSTLLLFTPRNLMAGQSPYYNLLREIALDFYNCNSSSQVTSLIRNIVLKRHVLQQELHHLKEKCATYIASLQEYQDCKTCTEVCCQSVPGTHFSHKKCSCVACLHSTKHGSKQTKKANCDRSIPKLLKHIKFPSHSLAFHTCSSVNFSYPLNYGSFHHMSLSCHDEHIIDSSSGLFHVSDFIEVQDDRVLKMLRTIEKRQCRHLYVALNYSDVNFPSVSQASGTSVWQKNFSGLGCKTNRTLSFVAMDAIQFHTFAEHLGLDILNQPHLTGAVILEPKQETQYLLSDEINKRNLAEFIISYTESLLQRHLRSMNGYYRGCVDALGAAKTCVQELTTDQFQKIVLDADKDVVVMYYAPWCGFCNLVAHVFLTVARYFAKTSGITFVRINGDYHDLPWEYTVDKYPSILFFPRKRKSESTEFPPSLPVTPVNLLHFVLLNAQPQIRWKIALQLCNHQCIIYNHMQTYSELQHLFRELHLLLNQLHFVQENLYKSRKMRLLPIGKRSQNLFRQDKRELQQETLFEYYYWLIDKIRTKKAKIRKARYIQTILRERGSLAIAEKLIYVQKTNTLSILDNVGHNNSESKQIKEVLNNNKHKSSSGKGKDEL